jgi:hypothetical protein
MKTLWEVAMELSRRLISIFLPDSSGRRPVFGRSAKFSDDPNWNPHLLFYEYFHGDEGRGVGASHQTGWTGLIAKLLQQSAQYEGQPQAAEAEVCLVPVELGGNKSGASGD